MAIISLPSSKSKDPLLFQSGYPQHVFCNCDSVLRMENWIETQTSRSHSDLEVLDGSISILNEQPLCILTTVHHLDKTVTAETWKVVTQVKGDTLCSRGKGKGKMGKLLYTELPESLLGPAFYPVFA